MAEFTPAQPQPFLFITREEGIRLVSALDEARETVQDSTTELTDRIVTLLFELDDLRGIITEKLFEG